MNEAPCTWCTISGGADNTVGNTNSATIGGGNNNDALEHGSTVGGGTENGALDEFATVGGGTFNEVAGYCACISGGFSNTIGGPFPTSGDYAFIGGGQYNQATKSGSTVSGGSSNTASGWQSTICGGGSNVASGENGTICGGSSNFAGGSHSIICGGTDNVADGYCSFAGGYHARALHNGSFVWSAVPPIDNTNWASSSAENQFVVRATGGFRFYSNDDMTTGVTLDPGGGSWVSVSDSTLKENIQPIDGKKILEKLAELEISRWNYKSQDDSIQHIGPMAQDFYRLFGVGSNNTTITTIDPDGISLAAIKALNLKLEQKNAKVEELQKQIDELKKMVQQLANKSNANESTYGLK